MCPFICKVWQNAQTYQAFDLPGQGQLTLRGRGHAHLTAGFPYEIAETQMHDEEEEVAVQVGGGDGARVQKAQTVHP